MSSQSGGSGINLQIRKRDIKDKLATVTGELRFTDTHE